jgi:hypothetical protein
VQPSGVTNTLVARAMLRARRQRVHQNRARPLARGSDSGLAIGTATLPDRDEASRHICGWRRPWRQHQESRFSHRRGLDCRGLRPPVAAVGMYIPSVSLLFAP